MTGALNVGLTKHLETDARASGSKCSFKMQGQQRALELVVSKKTP